MSTDNTEQQPPTPGEWPFALDMDSAPRLEFLTPEMLVKRLLWDIIPCHEVERILPHMHLSPDSDEGLEIEHRSSHIRLNRLLPLKGMIDLLTPLVSGITSSAMLVNSGAVPADAEMALQLQRHHYAVIQAGVVAILANLLDMGLITYTDGVVNGEQLLG